MKRSVPIKVTFARDALGYVATPVIRGRLRKLALLDDGLTKAMEKADAVLQSQPGLRQPL